MLSNIITCTIVPTQVDGARLKKSTAQWFRLANSARIFIYLSWYDYKNWTGNTIEYSLLLLKYEFQEIYLKSGI